MSYSQCWQIVFYLLFLVFLSGNPSPGNMLVTRVASGKYFFIKCLNGTLVSLLSLNIARNFSPSIVIPSGIEATVCVLKSRCLHIFRYHH